MSVFPVLQKSGTDVRNHIHFSHLQVDIGDLLNPFEIFFSSFVKRDNVPYPQGCGRLNATE